MLIGRNTTFDNISIPLFWVILNLEGNSCADRIDFLKRVVERLGISKIEVLLADREFIGAQWFRFLMEQKIPFVIRVKQNFKVEIRESGNRTPKEMALIEKSCKPPR